MSRLGLRAAALSSALFACNSIGVAPIPEPCDAGPGDACASAPSAGSASDAGEDATGAGAGGDASANTSPGSGDTPAADGALAEDATVPADAYVNATLGPGDLGLPCPFAGPTEAVLLGVATTPTVKPTTVRDGSPNGGGVVNVACDVSAGFSIALDAATSSVSPSSIAISGAVDATAGGQDLSVSITTEGVTWTSQACALRYVYEGGAVPASPPIAPGRVWAHVSCPTMAPDNGEMVPVDGQNEPAQCAGEVDFVFENCRQ